MNILVDEDGQVQIGAAVNPVQLLQHRSNGAYTAALMRGSPLNVVDWHLHEQRLVNSLDTLNSSCSATAITPSDSPSLSAAAAEALLGLVRQQVAIGMAAYSSLLLEAQQQQGGKGSQMGNATAMLLVYVSWELSSDKPQCKGAEPKIVVYCKAYQQPPGDRPLVVAVLGPPRCLRVASAKYSWWMNERKRMEAIKHETVAEGLLCDDQGCIIEGLTSNFFVIVDRQNGRGSFLMTCGPSRAALTGIVLIRVLEACKLLNLPVQLEPPLVSERHFWKEAFFTNCLREVQPVNSVVCPKDNLCNQPPWSHTLPEAYGNYTKQIQVLLPKLQMETEV